MFLNVGLWFTGTGLFQTRGAKWGIWTDGIQPTWQVDFYFTFFSRSDSFSILTCK